MSRMDLREMRLCTLPQRLASEEIIERTPVRYMLLACQEYPVWQQVNLHCKVVRIEFGVITNSLNVRPALPNTLDTVLRVKAN